LSLSDIFIEPDVNFPSGEGNSSFALMDCRRLSRPDLSKAQRYRAEIRALIEQRPIQADATQARLQTDLLAGYLYAGSVNSRLH